MIKGEMVHTQLAGVPHARHITVQECSLPIGQQVYYIIMLCETSGKRKQHNLLIVHDFYAGVRKITGSCLQYTVLIVCTYIYKCFSNCVGLSSGTKQGLL